MIPETITFSRSELDSWIRELSAAAISETLKAQGIKPREYKQWVSCNYAVTKMKVGRKRLDTAILKGLVASKIDIDKQTHCRFVFRADVEKLINNPLNLLK